MQISSLVFTIAGAMTIAVSSVHAMEAQSQELDTIALMPAVPLSAIELSNVRGAATNLTNVFPGAEHKVQITIPPDLVQVLVEAFGLPTTTALHLPQQGPGGGASDDLIDLFLVHVP